MRHDPSTSNHSTGQGAGRRVLRARGFLALLVALAETSAGCTLVIGERPDTDPSGDVDAGAMGEPDRAQDQPDADDAPDAGEGGSDASESDASGSDGGAPDADTAGDDAGSDAATDDAGAAMDAGSDASPDATSEDAGGTPDTGTPDAGPGCTTPTTWYPDDDEDGYGRSNEARQACAKPAGKWSDVGGDCRDSNADVHPNQTTFFSEPYSLGSGLDSFDYNCANGEEGDPGQSSLANGCMVLLDLGLLCTDLSGYMPRSDRTGGTRNSMCGSKIIAHCQTVVLSCVPGSPESTSTAYRCR